MGLDEVVNQSAYWTLAVGGAAAAFQN